MLIFSIFRKYKFNSVPYKEPKNKKYQVTWEDLVEKSFLLQIWELL